MSLFLKVFYLRNDANSSQNEVNFVRGEEMLSQRMDCWGYAVIFTEFSRIRLSRYDPNLRKWWVMVLNNPFTSLQNLELIIGDYYWPKILHGEVSPEHIARQILPSLFQNVMTPPITQDLSDVQAGASQHPAPFTGVQNPQWLRLSEHRHYQFEYGADMRGLSRLFGDPRQNPYLNTPSHEQPLSFYIPSTLNTTIRPGDRPRGPSARGGSSGSPRTYEARTGHPSSVQNVDASALRNSSIPQTLPPSPDWNARGGSAGAPGTNDAARRNSGIPPPPPMLPRGMQSPSETQTSTSSLSGQDRSPETRRSTTFFSGQDRGRKKQRPDSDLRYQDLVFDIGDDTEWFVDPQAGVINGELGHLQRGLPAMNMVYDTGDELGWFHEQDTDSDFPGLDIEIQNVVGQASYL
jgi:hypothetical protein